MKVLNRHSSFPPSSWNEIICWILGRTFGNRTENLMTSLQKRQLGQGIPAQPNYLKSLTWFCRFRLLEFIGWATSFHQCISPPKEKQVLLSFKECTFPFVEKYFFKPPILYLIYYRLMVNPFCLSFRTIKEYKWGMIGCMISRRKCLWVVWIPDVSGLYPPRSDSSLDGSREASQRGHLLLGDGVGSLQASFVADSSCQPGCHQDFSKSEPCWAGWRADCLNSPPTITSSRQKHS